MIFLSQVESIVLILYYKTQLFHFDHGKHKSNKTNEISRMLKRSWSVIEKELWDNIEDVKCSYCHAGE